MQRTTRAGTSIKPGRRGLALALVPSLGAVGLVALAVPGASAAVIDNCQTGGAAVTCAYDNTDEIGEFTVPPGVQELFVTLTGGQGGDGGDGDGPSGGDGGDPGQIVRHTLDVDPGQVLHVLLGEGGEDIGDGESDACFGDGGGGDGGVTAGFDGSDDGPTIAGGDGGAGSDPYCAGGGGGGASFVMQEGELPGESDVTPLMVAGGGGGGGGANFQMGPPNGDGTAGGQGGPGVTAGEGASGGAIGGGSLGSGGDASEAGGGGGGGGWRGGGAGGSQFGGAGGCGLPGETEEIDCLGSQYIATNVPPGTYHAASTPGNVIIEYNVPPGNGQTPPPIPDNPRPGGHGGPSSNDPNPNTNPGADPKPLPGMDPATATARCKPEKKICSVSVSGPDSRFKIDAEDGKDTAILFATMNGNWRPASVEASGKPNCPDYAEQNSDWVQFGFFEPERGKTWHKTGHMTQRQKMKRGAAEALAKKLQVCFAAPYQFPTRPGYRLGSSGPDRVGVLPECGSVRSAKGRPAPCVVAREIVKVKGGWTVRITFKIPANGKDPKALG